MDHKRVGVLYIYSPMTILLNYNCNIYYFNVRKVNKSSTQCSVFLFNVFIVTVEIRFD